MGLSPREMDFVEARNGAARDIALAFGVPPMLIGIPGDATYANYQEANRAFLRADHRAAGYPHRQRLCRLLRRRGGGRSAADPRPRPGDGAFAAERGELWSRLEGASFLTDAEKRAAVGYGETEVINRIKDLQAAADSGCGLVVRFVKDRNRP